jgi:hypothetical protein
VPGEKRATSWLLGLVLVGCGSSSSQSEARGITVDVPTPPAESASARPLPTNVLRASATPVEKPSVPLTGIAECDDYIETIRSCPKLAALLGDSLDQMIDAYRSVPPEARGVLAETCRQSRDAIRPVCETN